MKGNCYVWSLTGGTKDDPTMLHPRTKIPGAHKRAALKCLFSPDSWWVHCTFYCLHSYGASDLCWCWSPVSDAWKKVEHYHNDKLFHPGWDASPLWSYPLAFYFSGININSLLWVERCPLRQRVLFYPRTHYFLRQDQRDWPLEPNPLSQIYQLMCMLSLKKLNSGKNNFNLVWFLISFVF